MRKIFFGLILLTISLSFCGQNKSGYEINVSISGLQDSVIFLAYHFGDKQYLKDTITLDKKGHGIFKAEESLPQGIYMVVLPGKSYFEVLISDDQVFSITSSFPDYLNTLRFSGTGENSAFLDYQKKWGALQKKAASIAKRLQNNKHNSDSLKILTSAQKVQEEAMKSYLRTVIEENKGNILAALVRALLPVETPDIPVPSGSSNPDSLRWVHTYNFNKDHFFDNFDLTDERLLRTPILQARLNAFFTNIVVQSPDSLNKEIDKILERCRSNYKVFQFIAVYLFNHFRDSQIMGHDGVLVKLADDIYLSGKADWVSKEFIDDLKKQVDLLRPNLIGKKAENLVMDSYKGMFVSLYDIEKDFTILYFWEPDCGHCKEATPKLKSYYEKARNEGIEIFAVCTTSDKPQWTQYIEENKLTWINGWDPEHRSNYGFYYNVQSTPMVYILDKGKKIIAKKLSIDDIPSFIESYRKYVR